MQAVPSPTLWPLLEQVSRSFYLSLRVVPAVVREPLATTYLIARAADSIADSSKAPVALREQLLDALERVAREGGDAPTVDLSGIEHVGERELLQRLPDALAMFRQQTANDIQAGNELLSVLVAGMKLDLARFGAQANVLPDEAALDAHCFAAAGCVGEYWARLSARHLPSLKHLGSPALVEAAVSLGKALQLTNIIRDAAADLADGRCYVPQTILTKHGIKLPASASTLRPALLELVQLAAMHLDAGWTFIVAIPAQQARMFWAALWPALLAQRTLIAWLLQPNVARVSVRRHEVYRLVAQSIITHPLPGLRGRAFSHQQKLLQQSLSRIMREERIPR